VGPHTNEERRLSSRISSILDLVVVAALGSRFFRVIYIMRSDREPRVIRLSKKAIKVS
jgi:hypothetical protein